MTEQLAAAAVSCDTELVESLFALSFLRFFLVVLPEVTNWFTAAEASHRNYHETGESRGVFKPLGVRKTALKRACVLKKPQK